MTIHIIVTYEPLYWIGCFIVSVTSQPLHCFSLHTLGTRWNLSQTNLSLIHDALSCDRLACVWCRLHWAISSALGPIEPVCWLSLLCSSFPVTLHWYWPEVGVDQRHDILPRDVSSCSLKPIGPFSFTTVQLSGRVTFIIITTKVVWGEETLTRLIFGYIVLASERIISYFP